MNENDTLSSSCFGSLSPYRAHDNSHICPRTYNQFLHFVSYILPLSIISFCEAALIRKVGVPMGVVSKILCHIPQLLDLWLAVECLKS